MTAAAGRRLLPLAALALAAAVETVRWLAAATPWIGTLLTAGALFILVALALVLLSRRTARGDRLAQRNRELSESQEETRALAATEERLRLAQEMHEGQAQVLAYVNAKAQAVGEYLRIGKRDEAQQQLAQLAAASREVYADVKEAIFSLRYAAGVEGDLTAILQGYLEAWQDRTGVMAELTVVGTIETSPAIEAQQLRIVQEALANVRKHAGAGHVRVLLCQDGQGLSVTVEDDGAGFDTGSDSTTGHYGLTTMRERARAVGGSLELESAPGQGTRVLVHFPHSATPASGDH